MDVGGQQVFSSSAFSVEYWLINVLLFGVVLFLGLYLYRISVKLKCNDRHHELLLEALLQDSSVSYYLYNSNSEAESVKICIVNDLDFRNRETNIYNLSSLLAVLCKQDADRLQDLVSKLQSGKKNFYTYLSTNNGNIFEAHGHRIEKVEFFIVFILFHDVSEYFKKNSKLQNQYDLLNSEKQKIQAILDNIDIPVFTTSKNKKKVDYCNHSYSRLFKLYEHKIDFTNRKNFELVHNSQLKKYSTHNTNGNVYYILDSTEQDSYAHELQYYRENYQDILNLNIYPAAIFDKLSTKLRFYNHDFLLYWQLDKKFLDKKPDYNRIMKELALNNTISDAQDLLNKHLSWFKQSNKVFQDTMYLYNGKIIQIYAYNPVLEDGILFHYKDVTGEVQLQKSYQTLLEASNKIINSVNDPLLLISSSGRVIQYNQSYYKLWELKHNISNIHIKDLLDSFTNTVSDKTETLAKIMNNKNETEKFVLSSGIVEAKYLPLDNGSKLCVYRLLQNE